MATFKFSLSETDRWFSSSIGTATDLQQKAWQSISNKKHAVVSAPTGTGKTLAAFLWYIDQYYAKQLTDQNDSINATPNLSPEDASINSVKVIYVSPLKALSNDISQNLNIPVNGIYDLLVQKHNNIKKLTVGLRTGDTTQKQRAGMNKVPPDFLVTTPESLYLLLSSQSGKNLLSTAQALIVDEIHALQGEKRGSHLEFSIARLTELINSQGRTLQKIGLSATIHPLEYAAQWLCGNSTPAQDIDLLKTSMNARPIALSIELPDSKLAPVMSNAIWQEIYEKLQKYIEKHNTTLIFVQSRRLAERVAKSLSDMMGEGKVTSHHGSLSFEHRQQAELALKKNQIKAVITTSSLELGIDIGHLDLVIQLGSVASINQVIQRIGRSGRGLVQIPKGVIFPLSSQQLMEAVAAKQAIDHQQSEPVRKCPLALDALLQHISSIASTQDITLSNLFKLCQSSQTYSKITTDELERLVSELAQGFTQRYNRRKPLIYYDPVSTNIKATKACRLTVLCNSGVIPDNFDYPVVLEPENIKVGTISEDFATENIPGTILQLGNHSYRFIRLENQVLKVSDADGIPPTIPFWFGEGPSRSPLLAELVNAMRASYQTIWQLNKANDNFDEVMQTSLMQRWGIEQLHASEIHTFLDDGMHKLGALPDGKHIVFERFYDEVGDTHLVVHTGMGARLNRAWGLALRKRFCARFNFELQAAASDDAIILSLGATHSFEITEPASYLNSRTAEKILTQALLDAPLFGTRWRWVAANALAVNRSTTAGRVPPPLQRARTEDLLTLIFPDQVACLENIAGDREIPDHPLVDQTLYDCLREAMDTDGMLKLLDDIKSEKKQIVGVDTPAPSLLAHHVISSKPYAYLDDAGLEDRKTRAISAPSTSPNYRLLPSAETLKRGFPNDLIDQIRQELILPLENSEDLLQFVNTLGMISAPLVEYLMKHTQRELNTGREERVDQMEKMIDELVEDNRILKLRNIDGKGNIVYAAPYVNSHLQRIDSEKIQLLYSDCEDDSQQEILANLLRNFLDLMGPVTEQMLSDMLYITKRRINLGLLQLQSSGYVARGRYIQGREAWCSQDILARLFKRARRKESQKYKIASIGNYLEFLGKWQYLENSNLHEQNGLETILQFSSGLYLPLSVWEEYYFPSRLENYQKQWLDNILLSGKWVWYIRPEDRSLLSDNTPITFIPREQLLNLRLADKEGNVQEESRKDEAADLVAEKEESLSSQAKLIIEYIARHYAPYTDEFFRMNLQLKDVVKKSLAELVTKGLVSCDSFASLRYLTAKPRKLAFGFGRRRAHNPMQHSIAGRWTLTEEGHCWIKNNRIIQAPEFQWEGEHENLVLSLLMRYGVISYNILKCEKFLPSWRDISYQCRRMDAQGQLLSGRFINDGTGEQFASLKALQLLAQVRARSSDAEFADASTSSICVNATEPIAKLAINLPHSSESHAAVKIENRRQNMVIIERGIVTDAIVNGKQLSTVAERGEKLPSGISLK